MEHYRQNTYPYDYPTYVTQNKAKQNQCNQNINTPTCTLKTSTNNGHMTLDKQTNTYALQQHLYKPTPPGITPMSKMQQNYMDQHIN